jgi:O-antigen/teichoic acid export membrane protein
MIVVLPVLLPVVFGIAFNASSALLPILIVATGITAVAEMFEEILKGDGVSRPVIIVRLIAMLIMSVGAVLFVGSQGVRGMIYAVLVAAVTHLALLLKTASERFSLSMRDLLQCRTEDVRDLAQSIRSAMLVRPR